MVVHVTLLDWALLPAAAPTAQLGGQLLDLMGTLALAGDVAKGYAEVSWFVKGGFGVVARVVRLLLEERTTCRGEAAAPQGCFCALVPWSRSGLFATAGRSGALLREWSPWGAAAAAWSSVVLAVSAEAVAGGLWDV